jgi:hypothetical protein
LIWHLYKSFRFWFGLGFERKSAAGAFPSLRRNPTEEEERSDEWDPSVDDSVWAAWRVGWRARDWAEAGLRPRWERKAGAAGPRPRSWAEKEKGSPKEVLFFIFSIEFKSNFKFENPDKISSNKFIKNSNKILFA